MEFYDTLDPKIRDQLNYVATRLECREHSLVEAQWEAHKAFSSYDPVPSKDIERSALRIARRVVAALRGVVEQLDPDTETELEYQVGRRRAQQGVPTEDMVKLYRAVIAQLRDEYFAEAEAAGLSHEAILAGIRLLWLISDTVPDAYLAGHREVVIDDIRSEEGRRASFVIGLLTDSDTDRASGRTLGYGMSATGHYWLLRVPLAGGKAQDRVQRTLRSIPVPDGFHPLTAHFDGDLIAVLAHRPTDGALAIPEGQRAAIEGPVLPRNLYQAYAHTSLILDCADRFGISGLVDRDNLALLLAVAECEDVGETIYTRVIQPVSRTRSGEEILATLTAYLAHRCSVAETAEALGVHQNSVRYRLTRYAELTGVDLGDVDDLIEVWWALKFRAIRVTPTLDAE